MTRLDLEQIGCTYGTKRVLDDVTLTVADGEFLVIVGPSGCGKSTLLRIVAGLASATSGSVRMDGVAVDGLEPRERDVAMVFQNYALYPHMSVRKNLSFPLRVARRPRSEIETRVRAVAVKLGLSELLDRRPAQLSGGQMQRVALGRAMIRDPRVFLFDEPLSNLDAQLRTEMRGEIRRLHRELGITTLYVTHDQEEALTLGDRICVLHEGRIQQIGAPLELYRKPRTSFVARFIGTPAMNLVGGEVQGEVFRAGSLELSAPSLPNGPTTLGIRPDELVLGQGPRLTLVAVERLGRETRLECELDARTRLVVCLPGDVPTPAPGARNVGVELRSEALHWFDAAGRRLAAEL